MSESLDWAFCTPVPGEACAGWGIYVAGKFLTSHILSHRREPPPGWEGVLALESK